MQRKKLFQENFNSMGMNKIFSIILVAVVISGLNRPGVAGELINPRLDATYVKSTDGSKRISLSLSARIDEKRVSIGNAELHVTASNDILNTELGVVTTNQTGKAFLDLKGDRSIPKDNDGYYTFNIRFAGNQSLNEVIKTIRVKDIFMEMSVSKKDSLTDVFVKVFTINEAGEKVAVPGIPVDFFIKRIFCLYRFGGEKTDSLGTCSVEFPQSIPGDTTGKIEVVTRIIDHDDYATVETAGSFNGGNPVIIEPMHKRGLGDTDAPLWMVYTLLVLLSGVWLHVLYVILSIIRINIIGKRAEAEEKARLNAAIKP